MQLAAVIFTLLMGLVTALLVYSKSRRSGSHVYFSLLVLFIGIYPVCNYLALHALTDQAALHWAKLILFVSIPQGPLLYFFAKTFPEARFIFNKRLQIIVILWLMLNLILASMGLVFKTVSIHNGAADIGPGPLIPLFGLLQASTIIGGLVALFAKLRHAHGVKRRQLSYVFYGVFVSFTLTFLITFVLPIVFHNTLLLAVSPIFLALAIAIIAYAIIAQRLFDIRTAVVRAVAYTLSLLTLSIMYVAPIVYITSSLLLPVQIQPGKFVLIVIIISLAANYYERVRVWFNRATSKIFFRDAYDPEQFIAELNNTVVATLDLNGLLKGASDIIARNLTSQYCVFSITETATAGRRIVGTQQKNVTAHDIEGLDDMTVRMPERVIKAELLSEGDHAVKLILARNNIEILARLSTTAGAADVSLGYIMLGPKRGGEQYNARDVRTLETIINGLIVAIQNAMRFEEIQNFNITLQRRVDEATAQLRRTNAKLEALDETKDDFISMASHQLRTPLTAVKGYLSMLLEGDAGMIKPLQKKMLNQAFMSSQRMVFLIADLLNVSRLKTGKFVIERTPINLANLIQEEIGQLRETATSQSLSLTFEKPKEFPKLMLDETKTRQVVMNFIDNAVHYTPSGGHISVELMDKPHSVELQVHDDGIGVPKAEQHHLFTKFYRAANARRERPDGTGLGLYMAKKVIIAEGGAVLFKSREHKGSMFGFSIPKQTPVDKH